ncbi:hypothetical protein IEQ34_010804 [Dendrobium chrysotoxum]|uniref:Uncharacterized protein n=1 Tax=Dendrobium chrysotoxum TaxID=161865 RepID=A0AAV7GTT2_DENCH|nr:hypothetical protein IEQ34_010804 [Dendrobium chrysotoxum]
MVRLVFLPYTRVKRMICTSVSLRASTRVSSGFAPLRHSSPSFGSRHACSHANPSQKIWVGRWCTYKRGSCTSASLRPSGFNTCRLARMSGSLVRVSRRGCIPKQPDSPTTPRVVTGFGPNGALTLPSAPFQGTWARSVAEDASPDYNSSYCMAARFQCWAYPGSLAVTRGILISFFSSAY